MLLQHVRRAARTRADGSLVTLWDAVEHPARARPRSTGRPLAGRPVSHFFSSRPD